MERISVAGYRALQRQLVTLPSGVVFEIRSLQAWDFMDLGELPVPSATAGTAEAIVSLSDPSIQYMKKYKDRAIARGVIHPSCTDIRDDGGAPVLSADCLHVCELSQDDYNALSDAILLRSGLTKEEGQAIESFRDDTLSAVGESVGGALPVSAE